MSAPAAPLDVSEVLAGLDTLAGQRPVAAQLVAMATADDTGARELAALLARDLPLAGRVTKLANSTWFGMRGRVGSLQFAVTVVGFTAVRTMATVALTDLDDASRLPGDFWLSGCHLGQAAAILAPRFGEPPPDALCLGMLAQLGAALLWHHDPEGYAQLREEHPDGAGRRTAERSRYGVHALQLSATALGHWGFPPRMVAALERIDDLTAPEGALLRVGAEVAARLSGRPHDPAPVGGLCGGLLDEEALDPVLERVRAEALGLQRAVLG
ncbi:HDOD domain-containing protein [Geodermatophilus sp. SYSU D00758]